MSRSPLRLQIPQQPLDIIKLELGPEVLAEPLAQFLENAPRPLVQRRSAYFPATGVLRI